MPVWSYRSEEHELLPRTSTYSSQVSETDLYEPTRPVCRFWEFRFRSYARGQSARTWNIWTKIPALLSKRRTYCRLLCSGLVIAGCFTLALIIMTIIFRPSYTNLPVHYRTLQTRCSTSSDPGRGNINGERVFIAAALYDPGGHLLNGAWATAVLGLVDLLGPDNVYLSVYENDADFAAREALEDFKTKVNCNSTILFEHLPLEDIRRVTIPTGEKRMKRIAFLAEVRNRALRPLDADPLMRFDKLLFINDVIFDPVDAAQLLFSTNINASGRAQYGAACAVDFINAFKFYDTFATRDFEGYSMGIPFFPWFTDAGDGISRQDVLDQKDAVRVRACWGGMTAFEAKWFTEVQTHSSPQGSLELSPLRFRYEEDPFWDASECCLIHADLTYRRNGHNLTADSGIYTNPYVRVAYDAQTLSWLAFTRRPERLYGIIHNILNHLVGMPYWNPRREEQPGDEVVEKVWSWDQAESKSIGNKPQGAYHDVRRIASPGRFCGGRALLVLNDNPKPGEEKWVSVQLPAVQKRRE